MTVNEAQPGFFWVGGADIFTFLYLNSFFVKWVETRSRRPVTSYL